MTLTSEPWGSVIPSFDWDEKNTAKFWVHRISQDEVEQCFENAYVLVKRQKPRAEKKRYPRIYMMHGVTDGGRKLYLVVHYF